MPEQNREQLRAHLRDIGFRPRRFGLPLKMVRWALWPFIRPFYHFLLEKNIEALDQIDHLAEQNGRFREALDQIDHLAEQNGHFREEVSKLVVTQMRLCGELTALINRYGGDQQELDSLRSGHELINMRLEQLSRFQCLLNDRVPKLEDGMMKMTARTDDLSAFQSTLNERVTKLDDGQQGIGTHLEELSKYEHAVNERVSRLEARTQLSLSNVDYGIFLLKRGEFISDYVAENHTWDEHIVDVVRRVANMRNGTAVDVGAHIGLLTAPMARHFPRVISFEPNAFNYQLLVANMALNELRHVECIKGALFSRCVELSMGKGDQQEIPLTLTADGKFDGLASSNLGAYTFREHGSGLFPTFARTLDSYNLKDVAFIKIDAQGADGEVIAGAVETIRHCRPVIVFEWECELSKNYATTLGSVRELFQGMNYSVSVLKAHNQKQVDYLARPLA